jgi:hypothetical protein
MPQLIPIIVEWAAAQVIESAIVKAVVVLASTLAVGQYEQKQAARKANAARLNAIADRKRSIRSSESPRELVYGRPRKGGTLVDEYSHGTNGAYLTQVWKIADTECDAIEDVWLGDESIGSLDSNGWVTGGKWVKTGDQTNTRIVTVPAGGVVVQTSGYPTVLSIAVPSDVAESPALSLNLGSDYTVSGGNITIAGAFVGKSVTITEKGTWSVPYVRVRKYLGGPTQVADSERISETGGRWTTTDIGTGVCYAILTFRYDPIVLSAGIPNASFVVRGRKVFDPRTGSSAYSANPALCLADYLRHKWGVKAELSAVSSAELIASANICDEQVQENYYQGSNISVRTQARYVCAGVCNAGEDGVPMDYVRMFLASMAGTMSAVGGVYRIRAGAYYTPEISLNESSFAEGQITVSARADRQALFNTVRGTFIDPDNKFASHDFPPYRSQTYIDQDGGLELTKNFQLDFVDNAARCQRIAKLMLFRSRQATTITATFNMQAYRLVPGDSCTLTVGEFGWSSKVFKVLTRKFSMNGTVTLTLQEDAAEVYAWNYNEALLPDPAPNTNLPSIRTVPVLAGLALSSGASIYRRLSDGTVVAGVRVTWTAATDVNVINGGEVVLQFKRDWQTAWTERRLPGSETSDTIEPVSAGERLLVQARFDNGLGGVSAWTISSVHTVDAAAPANRVPITIGQGGNLIPNSDWRTNSTGWVDTSGPVPNTYLNAIETGGNAVLAAPRNFVLSQTGTNTTQVQAMYSPEFSVAPGRRYGVAIDSLRLRCDGQVWLDWRDAAGAYLASSTGFGSGPSASIVPSDVSTYQRVGGFVVAPSGARRAVMVIRKTGTLSGSDSAVWYRRPTVSVAGAYQLDLPEWDAGASVGALASSNRAAESLGSETTATSTVTGFTNSPQPIIHSFDFTMQEPGSVVISGGFTISDVSFAGGAGKWGGTVSVQLARLDLSNNLIETLGEIAVGYDLLIAVGSLVRAGGPIAGAQGSAKARSLAAGTHRIALLGHNGGKLIETGGSVFDVTGARFERRQLNADISYR